MRTKNAASSISCPAGSSCGRPYSQSCPSAFDRVDSKSPREAAIPVSLIPSHRNPPSNLFRFIVSIILISTGFFPATIYCYTVLAGAHPEIPDGHYVVQGNERQELMKDVTRIEIEETGCWAIDIFGQRTFIQGTTKSVDIMDSKVMIDQRDSVS
jgi:predicted RNA-binding protein